MGGVGRLSVTPILLALAASLLACSGSSGDSPITSEPTPHSSTTPPTATARSTPSTPASTPTAPRTGPLTTGPNLRPGEKPPVPPPAAKQHSSLGATQLGAYYFRALGWSLATNDDYLIRALAPPTCATCRRVIAGLAEVHRLGEVQLGGAISVLEARAVRGTFKIKSEYTVQVRYRQAQTMLYAADGSLRDSEPARSGTALVFVTWRAGALHIVEVGAPT